MKLNNKLSTLDSYPFHMPGHKRNTEFNIKASEIDITEIDGFDNLHNPSGILDDLQKDIAKIFGYKNSIISVNGSSGCILSAISAVCNKGECIIIARNCHKSVYNACYINELEVKYIEPEFDDETGIYTKVSQKSVDEAIKKFPNARAIVITSPTYEGVISEISADIPVIVDAAHGAHFGFNRQLPKRPNADIVINSLHKTLPSLTQTAVIHINNSKYYDRVKLYMDIFETSSPSYVLLSSVDSCIDFLKNSEKIFDEYIGRLKSLRDKIKNIKGMHLFECDDITRLIIYSDSISGTQLSDELRKRGIEPEGATINYVILISTVCDTQVGFELLLNALNEISQINLNHKKYIMKAPISQKKLNAYEVRDTEETSINKSEGKICGEYIYSYPPGVPIIVPGEIISRDVIDIINSMKKNNVNIISSGKHDSNIILTKK